MVLQNCFHFTVILIGKHSIKLVLNLHYFSTSHFTPHWVLKVLCGVSGNFDNATFSQKFVKFNGELHSLSVVTNTCKFHM